eukprot:gene26888-33057_t
MDETTAELEPLEAHEGLQLSQGHEDREFEDGSEQVADEVEETEAEEDEQAVAEEEEEPIATTDALTDGNDEPNIEEEEAVEEEEEHVEATDEEVAVEDEEPVHEEEPVEEEHVEEEDATVDDVEAERRRLLQEDEGEAAAEEAAEEAAVEEAAVEEAAEEAAAEEAAEEAAAAEEAEAEAEAATGEEEIQVPKATPSWHPARAHHNNEEVIEPEEDIPAEEEDVPEAAETRKLLSSRKLGRRLLADTPCPEDRFLLLGPRTYSGGFNNMMMTLESAILLAKATNRTFIVPPSRNERYNWLRFRMAIDMEPLRNVWPCFIDSDELDTSPQRHLLGKGKSNVGKIAAHKGLAPSDHKPKPGSYAAMKPMTGTNREAREGLVGLSIATLAGEQHLGRPEVRDYPVVRVGGSAWGGMMTECPEPELKKLFWSHVKPAADIKAEVEAFKAEKLGDNYFAVHLRWLEGKCPGRAHMYYMPSVSKQIAAMCTNSFKYTASIIKDLGLPMGKVFLASDRQRPEVD